MSTYYYAVCDTHRAVSRVIGGLREERDALAEQLRGAVEALRWYAEPHNWKGRSSGDTPAHADAGEMARSVLDRLGGQ